MLRSAQLVKSVPSLKSTSPAIYNSIKHYATPATPAAPAANEEKKERTSLSQRLGGTGRGKIADGSADPFASFLANAKKPRNGNFTPRPRRQQGEKSGQFADAEGTAAEAGERKPRQFNNRNNNNRGPRTNSPQRKTEAGAPVEGSAPANNRPRFNNRENNNNRDNNNSRENRDRNRTPRRQLKSQPQEVRARRATTFIEKDIDWSALNVEEQFIASTVEDQEVDHEALVKEINGDYDRYLAVGHDVKQNGLGLLVASNPTFDLAQKSQFLNAVASATGGK